MTLLVKRSIDSDNEPTLAKFAKEEFEKARVEFTISNKRLEILDIAINRYIEATYKQTTLPQLLEEVMPTDDTMNREATQLGDENFADWDTHDAIYNGMKWLKSKLTNHKL